MTKVYEYSGCSTCKKALKFLDTKKTKYTKIPIVDQPPSPKELSQMSSWLEEQGGTFKNLFNTSGVLYREMCISERLKNGLSKADAIELLSENGKLIKRPFLITPNGGTVGFKEDIWKELLDR